MLGERTVAVRLSGGRIHVKVKLSLDECAAKLANSAEFVGG